MRKEVDGEYGKSAFIETRAERIVPMTRRLARPYFRVGLILSVCLSTFGRNAVSFQTVSKGVESLLCQKG